MNKDLLFSVTKKDFEIQTFCSGGKGGQNQNRRKMGVRIIHKPSGAVGEGREERSQLANKRKAFVRMAHSDKMQKWLKIESSRILGDGLTPEERVDKAMKKYWDFKVETQDEEGKWVLFSNVCCPKRGVGKCLKTFLGKQLK